MLVFTLAGPSLVYVRRTAAQLNFNNEAEVGELIGILWESWVRGSQLIIAYRKLLTTWVRRLGPWAGRRCQLRIVYKEFLYKLGEEAGIMSWITCIFLIRKAIRVGHVRLSFRPYKPWELGNYRATKLWLSNQILGALRQRKVVSEKCHAQLNRHSCRM